VGAPACADRTSYRDRVLKTLRQPRYAALGVLMLLVALVCVGAGTWQIARFEQKRHENDYLRANAHAPTTRVDAVLPLVGRGPAPSSRAVEFRQVRVSGTYEAAGQTLVRSRTDGDDSGFLVVTPLRTATGTLLVVRGFAAGPPAGGVPKPGAAPSGPVTITARVRGPETRHDSATLLTDHQVESINPSEQTPRLGGAVYNGYAQLEAGQPGTEGVRALGRPDLSNPAGGALEPQHFAYVIQWYLFAALALAAPVVMARSETKQRRHGDIDPEHDAATAGAAPTPPPPELSPAIALALTPDEARAEKLADRYGRTVRR
jgi:cytochrome oxidase assembly protein ShyY1